MVGSTEANQSPKAVCFTMVPDRVNCAMVELTTMITSEGPTARSGDGGW